MQVDFPWVTQEQEKIHPPSRKTLGHLAGAVCRAGEYSVQGPQECGCGAPYHGGAFKGTEELHPPRRHSASPQACTSWATASTVPLPGLPHSSALTWQKERADTHTCQTPTMRRGLLHFISCNSHHILRYRSSREPPSGGEKAEPWRSGGLSRLTQACPYTPPPLPGSEVISLSEDSSDAAWHPACSKHSGHSEHRRCNPLLPNGGFRCRNVLILKHKYVQFENHQRLLSSSAH